MARNDTMAMIVHKKFADHYVESNRDSAMYYNEKILNLSKQLQQPLHTATALLDKAYMLQNKGNYPQSFKLINASMAISQ